MAKRDPPTTGAYGLKQLDWAIEAMEGTALRTVAFQLEWLKWVRYRCNEVKKPVTELIAKRTIRKIEEWGHDRAIAALRHSMESGWTGVFEPGGRVAKPDPTKIKAKPGKYDAVRTHHK